MDSGVIDMELKLQRNLKKLLRSQEMSLKQLSDELNLSPSTVHGWLNGVEPKSLMEIKKVAAFFGITFDELCFAENQGNERIETDIVVTFGEVSYKLIFTRFQKRGEL